MKTVSLFLLAASLLFTTAARAGYSHTEPFSEKSAFRGDAVLVIENVNGHVEVRAWDRNEIEIVGEKSAETAEELKQIDLKLHVSDRRAEIKVQLPKRKGGWMRGGSIRAAVKLTVRVPASVTLEEVRVVNSSVVIDGMRGRVNASSVNGSLQGDGLGTGVAFRTVNGSIKVRVVDVAAKRSLEFGTVNGAITVELPRDAGVSISARTVNGRVTSDFPLSMHKAFMNQSAEGTAGDGALRLEASTVNGSIKLAAR